MPNYKYKAKNQMGKTVEGTLQAENEADLVAQLRQRRMELVNASPAFGLGKFLSSFGGGGVTTKDVVIFSRQFSTMVSAGLPILQGLNIIAEQSDNKAFRKIIEKVRDDISNGLPLSDAMGKHPKVFSQLYVSMIRAGEQGGILDAIFQRLSEYLESSEALQRKIKSALMYPTVVFSAAILIIIFLMIKVVPTFEDVFKSFGGQLPGPTLLLMQISRFCASWRMIVLVAFFIGLVIAINIYKKTRAGAYQVDNLLLHIPVFGTLIRKGAVARFARTLSTLVKSGVPIMDAMETVGKTAGNHVIEKAVQEARESLKEGKTLSEPLRKSSVFPMMVTQMVSVGEETGALDAMLAKIADFYEEEVDTAVDGLTSIIEPILIVGLGLVVGFMVIAMFLPMFNMGNLVS
jgi:type IV pilus assembly protein PilC